MRLRILLLWDCRDLNAVVVRDIFHTLVGNGEELQTKEILLGHCNVPFKKPLEAPIVMAQLPNMMALCGADWTFEGGRGGRFFELFGGGWFWGGFRHPGVFMHELGGARERVGLR